MLTLFGSKYPVELSNRNRPVTMLTVIEISVPAVTDDSTRIPMFASDAAPPTAGA
jgi:hypothetical protein